MSPQARIARARGVYTRAGAGPHAGSAQRRAHRARWRHFRV